MAAWLYICPHCAKEIGLHGADLLLTFTPWRAPFERECPSCGVPSLCPPGFRASAWARFGFLSAWPVLAYALRITLYADTPSGFEAWGGGFLVGFIPALILSTITDRLGLGIENRRQEDQPDARGAMALYVGWLTVMLLAVILLKILV